MDPDLAAADKRYLWHPFTQMGAWCADDPLVLVRGEGPYLFDEKGRRYLDGNSSIWTNIHGHNHPRINAAIREQLEQVAHTSFLGATNPQGIRLAERLVKLAPDGLSRVFYSDDGSTAVEVALRLAVQFFEQNGAPEKKRLVAFERAYHGDTLGAASSGGIPAFRGPAGRFGYPVSRVDSVEALERLPEGEVAEAAALIVEPLVQGAAGIRPWEKGMLKRVENWCRGNGVLLVLDEVLTGFGRTGTMFACDQEAVSPDFLCVAKGLTGGYLPLAATLTTETLFEGFLNRSDGIDRTFYYGHSYCGNPLGCAAANASLDLFEKDDVLGKLQGRIETLARVLDGVAASNNVREVRRCGFIAAVEVGREDGSAYPPGMRMGAEVCRKAREFGLLTRPILDTVVVMLPLCVSDSEVELAGEALGKAIAATCGTTPT